MSLESDHSATRGGHLTKGAALVVENLEVVYDRVSVAVQGVSLRAEAGLVTAMIGTNGAGKTTVLRAISGFLRSDKASVSGRILLDDVEIAGDAPSKNAAAGVVIIPERDKVFARLTVRENLALVGSGSHDDVPDWEEVLEMFPALRQRLDLLAGYLSGGERQMLAVSQALLLRPRLLLADELSFGVAPQVVDELMRVVEVVAASGVTVLLVEQDASWALQLASRTYVLEAGRVVFDGTSEELLQHEDIREFYLGAGGADGEVRSYADVKQYRRKRRWW